MPTKDTQQSEAMSRMNTQVEAGVLCHVCVLRTSRSVATAFLEGPNPRNMLWRVWWWGTERERGVRQEDRITREEPNDTGVKRIRLQVDLVKSWSLLICEDPT